MDTLMISLMGVCFFCAGTAMGSFYNVLIDRLPNDQNVVNTRSECTYCHTTLKWYDLIPILSFLMLKGKCRYCGKKLSYQYMFSELAVGGLFLLAFLLQGVFVDYAWTIEILALWSMLFVTSMMDYKYGIIIDQLLLPFVLIGIAAQWFQGVQIFQVLLGALAGFAFYSLIYLIARLVYKKEGFGMGDVLLLTAIGSFLGPEQTLITGFLAFYCCLIFILILWIRQKKLGRQIELPFGPSICIAAFIVSLYGNQILLFLKNWFHIT